MRKSLFSSLKVIAMMLATDNEIHPKEKAWFVAITKKYGATFAERNQLEDCLSGKSTENLEEILSDIVEEFDRGRLLNFVRMAMQEDGIVKSAEIKLFYKIKEALDESLQSDYRQLARSLIKHDEETRIWKALDRFGTAWSKNLPVFAISGHIFYADGRIWEPLFELLANHKAKFLFGSVVVGAVIYWWR